MSTTQADQTEKKQHTEVKADRNKESVQHKAEAGKRKPARVRIFPIWLRIIVISILAVFALAAGLMIGYGILGDGEPLDALKVETWKHLIDMVTKTE